MLKLVQSNNNKWRSVSLTLLGIVAVFISFLCCEFIYRQLFLAPEQKRHGAEFYWRSLGNGFLENYKANSARCSWEDSLTAHPYLGWVQHARKPCGFGNNIGMLDRRDLPFSRDPDFFNVALLGGSVAAAMIHTVDGHLWLEEYLNQHFLSPNKKPFRIYSGATGAWSFPNQLSFINIYGERLDAVVALDGYNETKPTLQPITQPNAPLYFFVARPPQMGVTYLAYLSLANIRGFILESSLLRSSFLLFAMYREGITRIKATFESRQQELLGNFFEFPANWESSERIDWNKAKYSNYIKELKAISEAIEIKYMHFVQPIPQIGKPLSKEEQSVVANFRIANAYQNSFFNASNDLRKKGYNTLSLENVFASEAGTIYADEIHFQVAPNGEVTGNKLLAKAMGNEIARAWKLKRK